jgi:hypothetical protein
MGGTGTLLMLLHKGANKSVVQNGRNNICNVYYTIERALTRKILATQ